MSGLQRCMNCGHTDDFHLTNFICPSCHEHLTPIEGKVPMSIPLCTINAGYNHAWRFIAPLVVPAGTVSLWQCNDCHRIEMGRALTRDETKKFIESKEPVIVLSGDIPL